MNNLRKYKGLVLLLTIAMNLIIAKIAKADGQDGYETIFNYFFGDHQTREHQANCQDTDGPKQGVLGIVNSFFCHMENDMGVTQPTDSVTKIFGKMVVHASITGAQGANNVAANNVHYDYEGLVWVCTLSDSVTCTDPKQFNRAFYIAWSFNDDRTINKGYVLVDPSSFNPKAQVGTAAMRLVYDIGLATSHQTISARVLLPFEKGPGGAQGFSMRAEATLDNNVITVAAVESEGSSGRRFAGQIDQQSNIGGAYYEAPNEVGSGTHSLQLTAKNDNESQNSICLRRILSDIDYTYIATGELGCQVPVFPDESVNDVSSYTNGQLLGVWNNMSAHPTTL